MAAASSTSTRHALNGYAASLTPAALSSVRADPDVAYVEADELGTLATTQAAAPGAWTASIKHAFP